MKNTRLATTMHKKLIEGLTVLLLSGWGILLAQSPVDSLAVGGRRFDLRFSISPNIVTVSESLFYRRAGESVYAEDTLHRDPDTLRGQIPAGYVTIRGIEYYILLHTGGSVPGIVTYPAFNPANFPAVVPVAVSDAMYPPVLSPERYRMVSVPLALDPARRDILSVLGDDYGGTYRRNLWRVFRWQNGEYIEYPGIKASFNPGAAFWLITQSGISFTTGAGRTVYPPAGAPAYPVAVDTGWNQIADPFAYNVLWRIILAYNRLPDSLFSRPAFYNGAEYEVVDILKPWEGYFVYNATARPVQIFVPPGEAVPLPPLNRAPDAGEAENEYTLQLSAEIADRNLRDTHNYAGFWKSATPSRDRFNDLEPPPMGEFVRLSIVDHGREYMSSRTSIPKDGQEWAVRLYSSVPNQRAQITLSETGRIPDGFRLYVLDRENFNVITDAGKSFTIQLGEAFRTRSLGIIVGTKDYAAAHSGGIPLVPLAYSLEQNYPNPFNPETRIRYQLGGRSDVRLEIYAVSGQRIRTLVNGEQLSGDHTVVWNGTNDAGRAAPSGVYLCRLRANALPGNSGTGFAAGRKILLIR